MDLVIIDQLKKQKHINCYVYFDTVNKQGFILKITLPTRLSDITIIDNFLYKLTQRSFNYTAGILISNFTDNRPDFTLSGLHISRRLTQVLHFNQLRGNCVT